MDPSLGKVVKVCPSCSFLIDCLEIGDGTSERFAQSRLFPDLEGEVSRGSVHLDLSNQQEIV